MIPYKLIGSLVRIVGIGQYFRFFFKNGSAQKRFDEVYLCNNPKVSD